MSHACTTSPSFAAQFTSVTHDSEQGFIDFTLTSHDGYDSRGYWDLQTKELVLRLANDAMAPIQRYTSGVIYDSYTLFLQCHFSGVLPDVPFGVGFHDMDDTNDDRDDDLSVQPHHGNVDHLGEDVDLGDIVDGVSFQGTFDAPELLERQPSYQRRDFRTISSTALKELYDLVDEGG